MAEIIATGNLADDAQLRFTSNGRPALNFRIGDSKSRKDQNGNWETLAQNWFNVTVWGEEAEFYAEKLKKGTRVQVAGEFYQREYDRNDGGKGISLDVTAWGVRILQKRDGGQNNSFANTGTMNQQQPQQQQSQQASGGWNAPASDPWAQASANPPF